MTIILGRELGAQIQAYCPLSDRPGSGDWGADPGETLLNEKDREAKIAQFAKKYGFRLRFYSKGMCAIFDKWPRPDSK